MVLDPDLRIVAVSDAYACATRIRREEVFGRGVFEVFPDNPADPDADAVQNSTASFQRVLRTRTSDSMAVQRHDVRRSESEGGGFEERYWKPVNSPVLAADGSVEWIIHRVEDVTESIQSKAKLEEQFRLNKRLRDSGATTINIMEEAIAARQQSERATAELRESVRRESERSAELAAILDAVPTPIFFAHDAKCLHITGNRAADELLRHPRGAEASLDAVEESKPRHFKAFKNGRELHNDELPAQMAARGIRVDNFEFSIVFDDGTVRDVLSYAEPLWDEKGLPRGAINVLVDITERKLAEKSLHESEERLRLILEATRIGTFEIDFVKGETHWNAVEYQLLGLQPGDDRAHPETFFSLVHPDDAGELRRKWDKAQRSGILDAEFRIVQADGSERWLVGKGSFAFDIDRNGKSGVGEPRGVRFLGVNFDITDRKKAELALQESETQFRTFFENAGVGMVQIDASGHFFRVNDCFCRITGYNRDELLGGMQEMELVHPDDRDADREQFARFMRGDVPFYNVEKRYLRKDGKMVWAHVTATAVRSATGSLRYSAGTIADITERRMAKLALYEQKERLLAILNTAADAMIVIDKHGLIDSINPAAMQMFGYSADQLLGQNVKTLMPSPYHDEHDGYLRRYVETRQAHIIGIGREVVGRRNDGSTFPVDLAVSEIDHLGVFIGILRDITERKRLEKNVLEIAEDEQRRIGQELHDGTQQELTGISLLAGGILKLLKDVPHDAKRNVCTFDERAHTQLCDIATKLCQRLSEANRHVRQLAHGIMPVQIDAEGLRSALGELAAVTNGLDGIACQLDMPSPVTVTDTSTATQLYRIAQEAVNNAVRHGQAKEIHIVLDQQADHLLLEICDDGVGFDPEVLTRNALTHEYRGMGLRIMAYRAGMIGGTLQFQRGPSGGMSLKCKISSIGTSR